MGISALDDVSMSVQPGAVHAVIGPNGAGKSTLFNVVSGLVRPTEGTVVIGNTTVTSLRPHQIPQLGVSRMFQNLGLLPDASTQANMLFGRHRLMRASFLATALALPTVRRAEAKHLARVQEIAELFELTSVLDTPVHELSYGMRKRVEFARAVCSEPSLLLMDEPVAGMNGGEKLWMEDTIRRVRDDLDLTILLVEHDMNFVMSLCDHVTVLNFGRVIADGPPQDIRREAAVIEAYLGIDASEETDH
jgi:branched-chain amino acid transport system ATP-binding protein